MIRKYKFIGIIVFVVIAIIVLISWFFNHGTQEQTINPSALVQIVKPRVMPMAKTLIAYGTTNVAPEHIQQITIQNEAMVQQIFVTQGQHVNIGDPLLKLSTTASSSLNLENAKIAVDFAKKELDRLEKSRAQYLATNADVQTAKQNLMKSEATLSNLTQQQQNETGNVLKSTCNCNIVSINAQPGQVVAPATTLLTYANITQVQIRLGIEYDDLSKVHVGQKAVITPIYNSSQSYVGAINNITDQIDPKTNLIDVIVPLGNVSGLIPGSMVEGRIYIEPEKNVLAIPRSAVLYENNKPFVFIDVHGKAEKRWVKTAESNKDFIAVTTGVNANEDVVSVGNYELTDGMALRAEARP
ncbi:MAG: efflux RND transporter periplasmic adaptor subunit [Gammaproteobacteria bacterium]